MSSWSVTAYPLSRLITASRSVELFDSAQDRTLIGEEQICSFLWLLDNDGNRRVFLEGEDRAFSGTAVVYRQETMLVMDGRLKLVGGSEYFGTEYEIFADVRLDSFSGSNGRVRY